MITFYSSNLIDQSVISASTENALFPATNLTDSRRSKVFRSTSSSDSIVFDFGETSEVTSIVMVDNPRDGFGVITATLELNGTDTWGAPAYSVPVVFNAVHGIAFVDFAVQSYRFARLVITSTLGYCELSNIFIGKKIAFASDMGIDFGWTYLDKELSTTKENRYGQKFTDVISRQKQISFAIKSMNVTELDQVLEIYDDKGSTKPFFIRVGCDEMINDKDRFAGMFYQNSVPAITNKSFALYDISMTLEEAM